MKNNNNIKKKSMNCAEHGVSRAQIYEDIISKRRLGDTSEARAVRCFAMRSNLGSSLIHSMLINNVYV